MYLVIYEYISIFLFYYTKIFNRTILESFLQVLVVCWGWCFSFPLLLKWWFLAVRLTLYLRFCVYMSVHLASVSYILPPGIVVWSRTCGWRRCSNRCLLCESFLSLSWVSSCVGHCCFSLSVHRGGQELLPLLCVSGEKGRGQPAQLFCAGFPI